MSWREDEELRKLQEYVYGELSKQRYQPDPNQATNFYKQQAAKAKAAKVKKEQSSKKSSLLDTLKRNVKKDAEATRKDFSDGVDFGDIARLAVKPLKYISPTGGNFLRGLTDDKNSEDVKQDGVAGFFANSGTNFAAGVGNVLKGIGDTMEYVGAKDGKTGALDTWGKNLSDFAEKKIVEPHRISYKEKSGHDFNWKDLKDPDFYSTTVSEGMPFVLSFFIPGMAGAKGGQILGSGVANAAKWGQFGKTVAKTAGAALGGAAISAPLESAFEAGTVYDEAVKEGKSQEEADRMADETFWGNMKLLATTNAAEFATIFAPSGIRDAARLATGAKKAGVIGAKSAATGVMEGWQEGKQEEISAKATGKVLTDAQKREAQAAGFVMGAGMGLFGNLNNVNQNPEAIQRRLGDGDTHTIIANNVRQRMSPELEQQVNDLREVLEENGHPADDIDNQINEYLVTTEEGRQLVEEETENLVKNLQGEQTQDNQRPTETSVNGETPKQEASQETTAGAPQEQTRSERHELPNILKRIWGRFMPENNPVNQETPVDPLQPVDPNATLREQIAQAAEQAILKTGKKQVAEQQAAEQQANPSSVHPLVQNHKDLLKQHIPLAEEYDSLDHEDPANQARLKELDQQLKPIEKQMERLEKQINKQNIPFDIWEQNRQAEEEASGQPAPQPQAKTLKERRAEHEAKRAEKTGQAQPFQDPAAQQIQDAFAGLGEGAKEAGYQKSMDDVAKQGYTEFQKEVSANVFRNDPRYAGWREEKQADGKIRFYPPENAPVQEKTMVSPETESLIAERDELIARHEALPTPGANDEAGWNRYWKEAHALEQEIAELDRQLDGEELETTKTKVQENLTQAEAQQFTDPVFAGDDSASNSVDDDWADLTSNVDMAPQQKVNNFVDQEPEWLSGGETPKKINHEEMKKKKTGKKSRTKVIDSNVPLEDMTLEQLYETGRAIVENEEAFKDNPKKHADLEHDAQLVADMIIKKGGKPQEETPSNERAEEKKKPTRDEKETSPKAQQDMKDKLADAWGVNQQPSRKQMEDAWKKRADDTGFSLKEMAESFQEDPGEHSKEMLDVLFEIANLSPNIEVIKVGDPPKAPNKYDKAREKLSRLDRLAAKADQYLKDNKDRMNALPLDLYAAAAIVGANKIAHGVVDFAEWSEQMLKDYGPKLRLSLRSLYVQSEDIANFSDEDLDEYLESVGLSHFEEKEEAAEEAPKKHKVEEESRVEEKKELTNKERQFQSNVNMIEEYWENPEGRSLFAQNKWMYGASGILPETLRITGVDFPFDMTLEEYNHKYIKEYDKGGKELVEKIQELVLDAFDKKHSNEKVDRKKKPEKLNVEEEEDIDLDEIPNSRPSKKSDDYQIYQNGDYVEWTDRETGEIKTGYVSGHAWDNDKPGTLRPADTILVFIEGVYTGKKNKKGVRAHVRPDRDNLSVIEKRPENPTAEWFVKDIYRHRLDIDPNVVKDRMAEKGYEPAPIGQILLWKNEVQKAPVQKVSGGQPKEIQKAPAETEKAPINHEAKKQEKTGGKTEPKPAKYNVGDWVRLTVKTGKYVKGRIEEANAAENEYVVKPHDNVYKEIIVVPDSLLAPWAEEKEQTQPEKSVETLGVIDEDTPLPTVEYRATNTRITALFKPVTRSYTENIFKSSSAKPEKVENVTWLFPVTKDGYVRLPKGVSVSDINDRMNIEFYQEGVTAAQLTATFDMMNRGGLQESATDLEKQWKDMKAKIAGSGKNTAKHKVKLLKELKTFSEEHGFEFSQRYQDLLARFENEVKNPPSNEPKVQKEEQHGSFKKDDIISFSEKGTDYFGRIVDSSVNGYMVRLFPGQFDKTRIGERNADTKWVLFGTEMKKLDEAETSKEFNPSHILALTEEELEQLLENSTHSQIRDFMTGFGLYTLPESKKDLMIENLKKRIADLPKQTKNTPAPKEKLSQGEWLENPKQRSHVAFAFTPDEFQLYDMMPKSQKPAFIKSLLLENTDPRYAYDIYVKHEVAAGRNVEWDSKPFIEKYNNADTYSIHALRKYNLGFGKGLASDGTMFQVTMGMDQIVHVVYEPSSNRSSEEVLHADFVKQVVSKNNPDAEFSFSKYDRPIWADNLKHFLEQLQRELKQVENREVEKNVSNTGNPGTVPNGETAGGVSGTEKDGETQTVSSSNGTKPNGTSQQPSDGQFDGESNRDGVSQERPGSDEKIPSHPRNADGGPLPVDHVVTGNIYESGKKTRFDNNIAALQLLKVLQAENRYASAEEQEVLAKYQGWGGLSEYFDTKKPELYNLLKNYTDDLFTAEEYESMRKSTTTSFYTNHEVATVMYDVLEQAGFKGGRILEPSVGTGMFLGSAPENVKTKSKFITVEKDRISHLITKYLYPNQVHYHKGFEQKSFAENSFDVVIGNVPFSEEFGVTDSKYKDRAESKGGKKAWVTKKIHNYFLVRSMDLLRPGGIGVLITATNTLDKSDDVNAKTRKYLYDNADILDVVRLPNSAFKDAGTDVATDIIFFRKKDPEAAVESNNANISRTVWYQGNDYDNNRDSQARINAYFKNNPDRVAGDIEFVSGRYGKNELKYHARTFAEKFNAAVEQIATTFKNSFVPKVEDGDIVKLDNAIEEEWATYEKGVYDGAVHNREGKLVQYVYGKWVPFYVKDEHQALVKSALSVRDAAMELQRLERDKKNSTQSLLPLRSKLNTLYDQFVKTHGHMNEKGVLTPLEKDVRAVTSLRALERKAGKEWAKIDLFSKRQAFPDVNIDVKGNIKEAMSVSLANRGELDLSLIGDLMKMDVEAVTKKMEDENLIFFDPQKSEFVTVDEYLSGNVYNKLQFVKGKLEFSKQEQALLDIMPQQLTTDQVVEGIRFGQQWIPIEVYQQFLESKLNINRPKVEFDVNTASWSVRSHSDRGNPFNSHENTSTYGLQDRLIARKYQWQGHEIVETLMNQKSLKATIDEEQLFHYQKKDVEKERLTTVLRRKGDQLLEEFRNFIRSSPELSRQMTELYNNKFNSIVLRTYDGEAFYGKKPFPGLNPRFELMKHQKDVVVRTLQQQNALYAHVVGAGKTLEMQVSIMEGRRLGLIQKPVLVVPSFMLEQHSREFQDAYPNAKIKILGTGKSEGDLAGVGVNKNAKWTEEKYEQESEKNRMLRYKSLADVMYGDYDVVIMTYEGFERIPVSPEFEEEFLRREIDKLRVAMEGFEDQKSFTVKQIEKAIEKLETRIKNASVRDGKDVAISFEEIGFDAIFVDEAHNFKNLLYHSKMGSIGGLSNSSANRSLDMYMKTSLMNEVGGKTVFATGTPIANSVAEMFTMLRYLAPKTLEEYGMQHFDGWASQFGTTINSVELNTSGKFIERTRFAEFMNVPELMNMFKAVADVKMAEDLPYLKRPEVTRETITTPMSPNQRTYLDLMIERAIKVAGGIEPQADNMLKLTGEGKKLALDYRIIDGMAPNESESKLNTIAEHVAEEYFATAKGNTARADMTDKNGKPIGTFDNGTQLVFMDLGVPKADDGSVTKNDDGSDAEGVETSSNSMYQNLKDRLLELGVKEEHIAFIHDYNKPEQKKKLSEKFNAGEIRIIIGSTGKMGVGMNLQTRLTALHHADPTWRPADIEQREGRIIRQGNWNPNVKVKTYVTEGSFDALMWNTLENKAKFISQVMSGGSKVRSMDEIAELILSYSEIKASATNNEAMKKLLTTEKELRNLNDLEGEHSKQQAHFAKRLKSYPQEIEDDKLYLAAGLEAEALAFDITGEDFVAEMDGVVYSEKARLEAKAKEKGKPKKETDEEEKNARQLFREKLMEKIKPLQEKKPTQISSHKIATIGGLELRLDAEQATGINVKGELRYKLYLQHTASNGKMLAYTDATIPQAIQNDGQWFMTKIQNAIRPIVQKTFTVEREQKIKRKEAGLKEAKEKGGKPFPQKAELETLLKSVADLREEARQFELTNSFDTVYENGRDLYVVSGVNYMEIPSKNAKKKAEDKPDYEIHVAYKKITAVDENVEYLDEWDAYREVNVFKTESSNQAILDIEFIRNFTRREDLVGITDGTFQSRLAEIKRMKDERKAQAEQEKQPEPMVEPEIVDEAPAPSEPSANSSQSRSEPKGPHNRRIKQFGNMGSMEKVTVGGKEYWTMKFSIAGAQYQKFNAFMKENGGVYHGKGDKTPEFQSRMVFETYPEAMFEPDTESKSFQLAGGETMEYNVSPKTARQVSHKIAKALKTVLRPGNVGKRKAVADFTPHSYSGNVKNKWMHNLRVTAHELGHAFEERGFTGNSVEILNVGATYYPAWSELKTNAIRMAEGRAELFTLYILDPDEAAALAPLSVREIEQIIDRDAKVRKTFDDVHDIMANEMEKGDLEKAVGSIAYPSEKRMGRNIGDEYQVDPEPDGLGKAQTVRYKIKGFLKKRVMQIIDFKVPWKDVQKDLDAKGHNGKDIVKMLAVTGNAELHARNTFESWARDHRGRYIINYKSVTALPDYMLGLYGELNEMNPKRLNGKDRELIARYSSAFKEFKGDGLNDEDAKQKAILQALSSRSLKEIAEDGMVLLSEKMKDGTLPASFMRQIKNIKSNKENKESAEFMAFSSIMQAFRANERYSRLDDEGNQKFKEVYMDEQQAARIVEQVQRELPELEQIIKEYTTNLSDIILTKLVEAGVETKEARDRVEAASDFYVPTYYAERNPYMAGDAGDRKTAGKPIRAFRGRQAVAVDFLRATTYKLLEVEQSIEFKRVLDEVEDGMRQQNMGVYGQIIKPSLVPQLLNGERISKEVGETLRSILGDDVVDSTNLEETIANKVFTTFFPQQLMNQKILMNWHGEQKVFIRLAPDLYNSIVSMKPIHVNTMMRWVAKASSFTRQLAITNPRYLMNAMARDFFGTGIQNNAQQNFVTGYLKGAFLAAGKDPKLVDQYITSGAFMSAQENLLESFKRADITDGLIKTKVNGIMKTKAGRFVHVFKPENILKWQEQIARYGIWEAKAKELAAEYGVDPKKIFDGREPLTKAEQEIMERILLELGYEASEITTNFRTHGTSEFARKTIAPITFLHGSLQGLYRESREVRTNPKRAMTRISLVVAPMSLLSWAALQALDEDDKDDITSEMKDKYWIFPVGNQYFFLAKPFGYAIPTAYFERALDDVFGGTGARDWNEKWASPLEHNFMVPWLPIYGQAALDLYSNKAWYGGKIVANEYGSKMKQIDSRSSKLAEWQAELGLAIGTATGKDEKMVISPDKFDYAIRAIFGGPGQVASAIVDNLAGKDREIFKSQQLGVTPKEEMGSRFMDQFYTAVDKDEKKYQRDILAGKAVKGEPPALTKGYRQLKGYLTDMRKVQEVMKSQENIPAKQKIKLERQIKNAMNDVARWGTGREIKDEENLQEVLTWVEQYRDMD